MRPLTLTFQAFGSYPGHEVVDFEALGRRGLFVVTGPTGTGKTTVFDAMVFALFGTLPGGRSADGEARSHFAAPGDDTFVQFSFEVDGERYTIRRSPSYERPKMKGEGTTTAAAKSTLQRDSDGATLATKVDDCTKTVEALLGVSAKQFQRVVLLPQGKFTDFLIATDADREVLLRQLFGGDLYEQATRILKNSMDDLGRQVAAVDEEARHHLANADRDLRVIESLWGGDGADTGDAPDDAPDDLRDEDAIAAGLEAVEKRRADRQTEIERLNGERDKAVARQTEAEAAADRHDRAARHTRSMAEIDTKRPQLEADAAAAESSAKARPVVVAETALESARAAHDSAVNALADANGELERGFTALGMAPASLDSATVAGAVATAASAIDSERQRLQAAAAADRKASDTERDLAVAVEARDTARAQIDATNEQMSRVTARIAEVGPIAGRVEVLNIELDKTRANARSRERLAEVVEALGTAEVAVETAREAYEATMRRFVHSTAPRLAAELRDGEPCSVCGSLDHPAPASLDDGEVVEHDEVDRARAAWTEAETMCGRIATERDVLRDQLGALADESVESMAAKVASAMSEAEAATRAATELAELEKESARLADSSALASARHLEAFTTATDLGGRAKTEREEAQRLAKVAAGIEESALDARSKVVSTLKAISDRLATLASDEVGTRTARDLADAALTSALAASGFATADAARAALLEVDEEKRRADALAKSNKDYESLRAALGELESQGVPAERPDVDAIAADAARITAAALDAATDHTTALNALESCRASLGSVRSVAAGSADLRRKYDTARVVFRTCNGEAGAKIKMERWVLAGELDRVTMAANVHLARMTNHRFALQRDTSSKGGLGLQVSDAHTGRPRATASLSGGEQFQASLALALGLADVVSLGGTGSGRTFEALFVDEGFGSLDPVALDQAIDALMQLHATGRMVGAITHVEAMKQSLHVGIEVRRLADGGGSTLTVNP